MPKRFAVLLLLLASCGRASSDNPFAASDDGDATLATSVDGIDYGNRHSAGLARATSAGRMATLAQAVRSTNRRCASATRSEYKGALDGRALWAVDCGGSDYLLEIGANGSTRAETCAVQAANGPGCWEQW